MATPNNIDHNGMTVNELSIFALDKAKTMGLQVGQLIRIFATECSYYIYRGKAFYYIGSMVDKPNSGGHSGGDREEPLLYPNNKAFKLDLGKYSFLKMQRLVIEK